MNSLKILLGFLIFAFGFSISAKLADGDQKMEHAKASIELYVSGHLVGDGKDVEKEMQDLKLVLEDDKGKHIDLKTAKARYAANDKVKIIMISPNGSMTSIHVRPMNVDSYLKSAVELGYVAPYAVGAGK